MDTYTQIIRDPKRLSALRRLLLLDTPPEAAYDRITRLAARILKVPVAFLTLVDEDRQFFKSQVGLPEPWASRRETPLTHSFCQYTITSDEPLVVADARQHPLLRDSAAIPELKMIGYAGVPVLTSDGHALGAFCVSTPEPRDWSAEDIATLKDLAQSMASEIELHGEIRLRQRLGDALSQQLDMMTMMYKLSAELTHQLSQEFVVAIALDAALRFTRADCGYIALIEAGQLKVVELIGPYDEARLEAYLRRQPNQGLIARVLSDRLPVLLADATSDPEYEPLIETTAWWGWKPARPISSPRIISISCCC
jgi:GAF domain-containing protein